MFCQKTSLEGRTDENTQNTLEKLIFDLTGTLPKPLNEAEFCCGFGGFTSLVNSGVSNVVLSRKIDNLDMTDTKIWVTDNPGCVLHLRNGAKNKKRDVAILHISEYLAQKL